MTRIGTFAVLAALAGCSGGGAVTDIDTLRADRTIGGVTFHADTRVMESFPVQLGPVVEVRNRSGEPATLVFPDPCAVGLRVYRDSTRAGAPAWVERKICAAVLHKVELAPGETELLQGATIGAARILGDSLPAGRYYLSVVLSPNLQTVELAAGEADLAQ